MEIIEEFGINPILLGAQVVNFLIIFYLLKRFLYKPVQEMLKNREHAIRDGLKKAEEQAVLLEKTKEEERQIIKKAKQNVESLLKETKEEARNIQKDSYEKAKTTTEKMIEEAKEQIQKESQLAQKSLVSYTARIAVSILEKSLSAILSEKDKNEITQKAIKKLQNAKQ